MTLMNLKQAAEFLNISPLTLRKMAIQGQIPHKRLGNKYLFVKEKIEEWLLKDDEEQLQQNIDQTINIANSNNHISNKRRVIKK